MRRTRHATRRLDDAADRFEADDVRGVGPPLGQRLCVPGVEAFPGKGLRGGFPCLIPGVDHDGASVPHHDTTTGVLAAHGDLDALRALEPGQALLITGCIHAMDDVGRAVVPDMPGRAGGRTGG